MAQRPGLNLALSSVDDLFGGPEVQEQQEGIEQVVRIPLNELYGFRNHPYTVEVDDDFVDTIRMNGVLLPGLVRPREQGGYEIVSGHRRRLGSEQAGLDYLPVIVREMDDDTAIILMVDSNNQRENVKPSQKARALKMKYEAMKRQGIRNDLTSGQIDQKLSKLRTIDIMAEQEGMKNATELQRTMKAADLEGGLRNLYDDNKLSLSSAAELSQLPPNIQEEVADLFQMEEVQPTLSQAMEIRALNDGGSYHPEKVLGIIQKPKPQQKRAVTLKGEKLEKFYTDNFTPAQFEELVYKALDEYFQRQRKKERQQKEQGAR